jgi:hypothetical protein
MRANASLDIICPGSSILSAAVTMEAETADVGGLVGRLASYHSSAACAAARISSSLSPASISAGTPVSRETLARWTAAPSHRGTKSRRRHASEGGAEASFSGADRTRAALNRAVRWQLAAILAAERKFPWLCLTLWIRCFGTQSGSPATIPIRQCI